MRPYPAIGHLDADCFYVSAERVRDPFLKSKPVGVLGNNGACVIARSYEMRDRGVRTGEPIWDAVKLCPDGVYVKRDFRWYEVLSRKMFDIIRSLSNRVEFYSIDEFFFVADPLPGMSMERLGIEIRDRIMDETALPVTVGIARTRTLAKLLSDTFKPFGAKAVLTRAGEEELLAKMPVTAISGIAAGRAAKLAPYNVKTCLDLARFARPMVRSLLTVTGETIWRELNGEPTVPISPDRPLHKMLSRGGSIGWASDDRQIVFAWLVRNLERLIEELHFHQVRTSRLSVWIGHKDVPDTVCEVDLESPTDRFDILIEAARACLQQAWRDAKVSRMQILATQLRGPGLVQRSLFEKPAGRQDDLAEVKREINRKLGRFTLRSGATLPLYEIYRDESCSYDICDVHGKVCF